MLRNIKLLVLLFWVLFLVLLVIYALFGISQPKEVESATVAVTDKAEPVQQGRLNKTLYCIAIPVLVLGVLMGINISRRTRIGMWLCYSWPGMLVSAAVIISLVGLVLWLILGA